LEGIMKDLEKDLEELIDAVYSNEDGVDERTHLAVLSVVYTFHCVMSGEETAEQEVKKINAKVDATDGRFYF
jgi:hypothetical protein